MPDRDRLSNLILAHWSRHCPLMLAELRQQKRLHQALEETAERFTDLLYDLISVHKMSYHQAWEMAVDEMLPPEGSFSTSSQPFDPPATSKSPTPTG